MAAPPVGNPACRADEDNRIQEPLDFGLSALPQADYRRGVGQPAHLRSPSLPLNGGASPASSRLLGLEGRSWKERSQGPVIQYSPAHHAGAQASALGLSQRTSARRTGQQQPSQRPRPPPPSQQAVSEMQLNALDSKIKSLEACFHRYAARET